MTTTKKTDTNKTETKKTAKQAIAEDSMAAREAAALAKRGIESMTFTATVRGEEVTLTCPRDIMDASVDAYRGYESGNPFQLFEGLLGRDQWKILTLSGITAREVTESLMPAWFEAQREMGED